MKQRQILKCIMPTCGREIESDRDNCVCTCGNNMYPKPPEKRIREVKKEIPVQEDS